MNKRGLTDLGMKIFLDRYSVKDTTRQSLQPGSTVLVKLDDKTGQKEIAEIVNMNGDYVDVIINPASDAAEWQPVATEHVDVPLELDPMDMWKRVAQNIAEQETTSDKFEEWLDKFQWLLEDWKFVPGGRVLAGAGTDTELTLFNCYVIPSPKDSKDEIFKSVNLMAQLMARGGGVGINISSLRPKYAYAKSTNGRSSGAVSWGELYSYTTGLIEQGGSRRGALLLMLDDWHPDLLEYIDVKRDNKRIVNANISVAISDDFMQAVKDDADWKLIFPDTTDPSYDATWDGNISKWIAAEKPIKVWKTLKAREVWDAIINSAWACAEPGLWFKDVVNNFSNSWYYAPLISTNPCGEISLPQYGCCNLGAINLSKFIAEWINSDTQYSMNWQQLCQAVRYAVRFLDNVIDATPYAFPEIEQQQKSERRIGLGTMGLAEVLIKLQLRYGSPESIKFIDELYSFIAIAAYNESVNIAIEKGCFPKCQSHNLVSGSQFMANMPTDIKQRVLKHGLRNVTLLTQAPTGTIGTMVNTSTGIEPFYFWEFERKGRLGSHIERVKVYEEWLANQAPDEPLPSWFVTAQDLTPEEHVKVQAAVQRWVDSSISKTCNVPNDYTVEQVKELYELMYELGCKGGTIYRDGSRSEQVLSVVKPSNSLATVETTLSENKPAYGLRSKPEDELATRSRPNSLSGKTYRKQTPVGVAYCTVNRNGTEDPFEMFISVGKAGSSVQADAEGYGRLISFILRMPSSMPVLERIENIVAQLSGIGSGQQYGFGKQRVMSLPDAIAQVLAEHTSMVGELPKLPEYETEQPATLYYNGNADICPGCGNASLMRVEGCQKCYGCGHSQC